MGRPHGLANVEKIGLGSGKKEKTQYAIAEVVVRKCCLSVFAELKNKWLILSRLDDVIQV
jgi:hypothetical protein